jgi:hypothetical protein
MSAAAASRMAAGTSHFVRVRPGVGVGFGSGMVRFLYDRENSPQFLAAFVN